MLPPRWYALFEFGSLVLRGSRMKIGRRVATSGIFLGIRILRYWEVLLGDLPRLRLALFENGLRGLR